MSSYLSARTYNGKPAGTIGITNTVRVNRLDQASIKRVEVVKPVGSKAHQATDGRVWAFQPDVEYACCKRRCMSQFTTSNDPRIVKARAPLRDSSLTKDQLREKLIQNWENLKTIGENCMEVKVCTKAACKVFRVSKCFLYFKQGSGIGRAKANMLRAKKNVAIGTWLEKANTLMDVMPDDGTFICQYAKKQELYQQYRQDASNDTSGVLETCTQDYFLKVWSKLYQEIRVRKHCRFAKCDFCEERRGQMHDQSVSVKERVRAKLRYKDHVEWAHIRERGDYHSKILKATTEPEKYLSIAVDGTDQMPQGFPHFRQKLKDDGTGMRLKVHTQIAMVHGRPPMVFVATEEIRGDPNLTIECLNRIIKREETQRPNGLPDTMYLTFDNCFRENRNTYIFAYLVWIIERTVFREIFVSFLPVGHTHFDPDQFASRISVAVKDINITSIPKYVDILRR